MTRIARVTIGYSTRTDVSGRFFAQVRMDGRVGPHINGDRDEVHAWIKRLEDQAERHGVTVEIDDETTR